MIVGIKGGGIAAAGCVHLLRKAGIAVTAECAQRLTLPSVMLSAQTLALMGDVFDRPAIFTDRPRICRRVIAWGNTAPQTVPHDAVLLSEAEVQAELAEFAPAAIQKLDQSDYTIFTASPMPEGGLRTFGERHAVAAKVSFRDSTSMEECRIEAVEIGWLFLVPAGQDQGSAKGWLLGVGASLDDLLGHSRIIAPLVDCAGGAASVPFLAAPRLHMPLCGSDWLGCGTAALGFDPICGDGTAQSVREAILASAVVVEIAQGGDVEALMGHYQSVLIAAMRRHLALCAKFYRSGGQSMWWLRQYEALLDGHEWCTRLLAKAPEPRYMLHDFRLVPRQQAA